MNAKKSHSKSHSKGKPAGVYSGRHRDRDRGFLAPRYWLTWLGVAFMALLSRLPRGALLLLGKLLGNLFYLLGRSRRHTTRVNIGLCFNELNPTEQASLVKASIRDNAVGFLETCIAWFNPGQIRPDMIEISGQQHLIDAVSAGQGVILVGAHYSTLDLGGLLMSKYHKVGVMYRANKNPLFDRFMRNSRQRFCATVIERGDMRSVIRFIRQGGVMWYAPDQDYGPKQSVFAPFFGVEAATITVIPRLVKINNSAVLILAHHRTPDGKGYRVSISKPLSDYPTGDDVVDATTINRYLEDEIRKFPAQYMWLHRRFKTRPKGQPGFYSRGRNH